MIKLKAPLSTELKLLRAGDEALISGVIYTARDAAHKKLYELLAAGKPLPFDARGAVIYYVGISPPRSGYAVGAAGPTTSSRMDAYTPRLLEAGVKGLIGKGARSKEVMEALKVHEAVYFAAMGGAGALLSSCIKASEIVAFEELGTEAVRMLTVENMPVVVAADTLGNDVYAGGRADYLNYSVLHSGDLCYNAK